nr:nicotinamide riboside transporter PnuC [Paludibacteraceae bacterium]
AFGLLIQIVTFAVTSHLFSSQTSLASLSYISLLSGCLGVCSVCLTAQGKIETFIFGFAQVITYTYLCVRAHLYGEIAINIYYFLTMIYGVYVWRKRLDPTQDNKVRTRHLSWTVWLAIVVAVLVLSGAIGWLLAAYTDDPTPYLDSFTTVTSVVAQVLMILVYRDQWFLWLAVDMTSIAMWLYVGDYCMTAQYAFWCCNCVYGYYKWKGLE